MSNIDLTQIITPEAKAASASMVRAEAVKAECRRRIFDVASTATQMNLTSHAASGLLSKAEAATYKTGLGWIEAMLTTCRALAADPGTDFTAATAWPPLPGGVADLVARF